jgi:hypothetical protein
VTDSVIVDTRVHPPQDRASHSPGRTAGAKSWCHGHVTSNATRSCGPRLAANNPRRSGVVSTRPVERRFPETEPLIVHRVYRLDRARAQELFDTRVANAVPEDGLVDVHRYLTIVVDGRRITIDATFPGPPWDGRSSLPLACGPGRDYPAGEDPDAEKRALEANHCDPAVREPFIAALASVERSQR